MPHFQLRALHDQMVTVVTHTGIPIAVGRLQVVDEATRPLVELHFKTEVVKCSVILLPHEVRRLCETYNGEAYRHVLPGGDLLWRAELPEVPAEDAKPAPAPDNAELVETFPLPPAAKLGAVLPEQLSKEGRPPSTSNDPTAEKPRKPQVRVPVKVEPVRPLSSGKNTLGSDA